jgi:Flp pilus assembly protein TadG
MFIRTRQRRRFFQQRRLRRASVTEDAGQALLELALTVPLLVLILLGAAEFSRLAYAAVEVANAAKAGVRCLQPC